MTALRTMRRRVCAGALLCLTACKEEASVPHAPVVVPISAIRGLLWQRHGEGVALEPAAVELRSRSPEIRKLAADLRGGELEAHEEIVVEILGLHLSRITQQLQETWGLSHRRGVVVVDVSAEAPLLSFATAEGDRSVTPGDVFLGVDEIPVDDPLEFWLLFLHFARQEERAASVQWKAAPGSIDEDEIWDLFLAPWLEALPGQWREITLDPQDPLAEEPASEEPGGSPKTRLEGTITVAGADGEERAPREGRFTLTVDGECGESAVAVSFLGGEWSADVLPGDRVQVAALRLEGKPAYTELGWVSFPAEGSLSVAARWARPLTIRLLEQDSGREIEKAKLLSPQTFGRTVSCGAREGKFPAHEEKAVALEPLGFPLEVPLEVTAPDASAAARALGSLRVCFILAEGYVWSRLSLDSVRGGEHVVKLRPGAALDVWVSPPSTNDLPLFVRASRIYTDEVFAREAELEGWLLPYDALLEETGRAELRGLPPGEYTVTLQFGGCHSEPLAQAMVALAAGASEDVFLSWEPPGAAEDPVPVAGTLRLPASWLRDGPGLDSGIYLSRRRENEFSSWLHPPLYLAVAGMERVPGTKDLYRWDAGERAPGPHVLSFWEAGVAKDVDVGSEGATNLHLDVPDGVHLSFLPRDARTGEAAEIQRLRWTYDVWEDEPDWKRYVDKHPLTRRFHGVFRPGRVFVKVDDSIYEQAPQEVAVTYGAAEHVIDLEPCCGVEFTGDMDFLKISFHSSAGAEVEVEEGWWQESHSEEAYRVRLPEPGRYELSISQDDGQPPLARRVVEVERGEFTRVELDP